MSGFNPQAWDQTSVDENSSNTTPPDPGSYEVVLRSAKAFTSKAGDDYLVFGMQVVGGPQAGYEWDELRNFKNDGAYKAAKATCQRLGVNVDQVVSLEQLDVLLKEQVGNWYAVEVKQNGEYRNCYVNARVDTGHTDVPANGDDFLAPAAAGTRAVDIPF